MEKERISLEELYKLLDFPAEVVERLGQVQLEVWGMLCLHILMPSCIRV